MALTVTPAELTATALTLTTAAQPNITSVGTLSGLTTAGITMSNGGDRVLTGPLNQSLLLNARPNDATEGLKLQINGAPKLSVLQNGSVTIGGTGAPRTVGWGDTKLQIEGTSATDSSISIIRNAADNNPPYVVFAKSRGSSIGSSTVVQDNDYLGVLRFNGADGTDLGNVAAQIHTEVEGTPATDDIPGALVFSTSNVGDGSAAAIERLRIRANGNVGIGATAPVAPLHVYNSSGGNATSKAEMLSEAVVKLQPHTSNSTNMLFAQVDNGSSIGIQVTNGPATANWDLSLSPFGGRVGIGEVAPDAMLHVKHAGGGFDEVARLTAVANSAGDGAFLGFHGNSTSKFYGFIGGYDIDTNKGGVKIGVGNGETAIADSMTKMTIDNTGITTFKPGIGDLSIKNNDSSPQSGIILEAVDANHAIYFRRGRDATLNTMDFHEYTQFRFYTGGAIASQTEKVRIDSNGLQITMGTQTGWKFRAYAYDSDSYFGVYDDNNHSANIKIDRSDGLTVFYVMGHTGNYHFYGSDTSDRDLKENIISIPDGSLSLVKQLKPCTFNFHAEGYGKDTRTGFIAQEVAEVFTTDNHVATGTDGNKDMGVDHMGIIAHLTKAVQELSAEVESLKEKLNGIN